MFLAASCSAVRKRKRRQSPLNKGGKSQYFHCFMLKTRSSAGFTLYSASLGSFLWSFKGFGSRGLGEKNVELEQSGTKGRAHQEMSLKLGF